MTVLVAFASKHGATEEIADAIGEALRHRDVETNVLAVEDVTTLEIYDAVVLGSAIYAGHWREEARELVEHHGDVMRHKPVWLFSSGPLGDPPEPGEDPVEITDFMEALDAKEHRLFAGKADPDELNFGERAIMKMVKAPYGDFRPWTDIDAWAAEIAESLKKVETG